MLYVAIQELVHNVHHVSETCDFPNFLEPILRCLRTFHLFKGNLLKAIPCQLLDGVEFSQPASRSLKSLICSLEGHLMSPALEISTSLDAIPFCLQCSHHTVHRSLTHGPLVLCVHLREF